jgi:putative ABC transport system permease protein
MLLSYLKFSLRLLTRNPFFTFINVAGLSVGFATFLLLYPYTAYELKSDQYHKDSERIARLSGDFKWTDDNKNWNGFLAPFNFWGVASGIKNTFPQVEAVTRLVPQTLFKKERQGVDNELFVTVYNNLTNKKTSFRESQVIFADHNFFQFFTIPIQGGDPHHILDDANSVAISEKTSKKYFGEETSIGKTIYLNDSISLNVTAVFEDLPENTHLRFDMVISVAGKSNIDDSPFGNGWVGYCYLKARKGYDLNLLAKEFHNKKASLYAFTKSQCKDCDYGVYLQPLHDVIFSNLRNNEFRFKSKYLLQSLSIVSFLVLIMAWINYINMSIRSLNNRLKELGTRKVMGAQFKQISLQFLTDSIIINLIAFAVALTIFQLIKTPAEALFGFYIPSFKDISGISILIITLFAVGGTLITALYPLLLINKKGPMELFTKSVHGFRLAPLNLWLVTSQYISAIVLITWIATVYSQLNFVLKKELGIQRESIVIIEGPMRYERSTDAAVTSFIKETKRISGINAATMSHSAVGDLTHQGLLVMLNKNSNSVGTDTNGGVDEHFLDTYNIQLIAGRNFMPDNPADQNGILVSKTLVERLGISSPEEAIGKRIMLPAQQKENIQIIGVINDYEFRPLYREQYERRGVTLTYKNFLIPKYKPLKFSIALDLRNLKSEMHAIEKLYKQAFPDEIFKWYLLNDKIEQQYHMEMTAKNQIMFFTILAVGIACLGLLGMISNKVVEKTKEIGIRKVLGAQIHQIGYILLNTTIKQISLSTIIGLPIAYYFTQQYLEKFSERIELQWWHYTIPVLILIVIMFASIVSVLIKAARTNPVKSLRYE